MHSTKVVPTGVERTFDPDQLIVSKTDAKGILTYVNDLFCTMAAAEEHDLLGRPHNLVRHPEMPRAMFAYMWTEIAKGQEVFVYVKNLALDGTHYWVFAHVTATLNNEGAIIGYHSNRRSPDRRAVATVEPIYRQLCEIEGRGDGSSRDRLKASTDALNELLAQRDMTYDQFVWSLTP